MTAQEIIADVQADGRSALTEAESKALFTEIGIAVPEYGLAGSTDEATAEAERIGYPVVAKVSSPEVQHKTEWGGGIGVNVGLASEEEVRTAADRIFDAASDLGIEVDVLVEEMVDTESGTELIVGGLRDRSFGPAILVGLGGVFTEIFADTSHRLAPLSADEAHQAIAELRAVELLEGYRGAPPADIDALANTVQSIGTLVAEHDAIAEVDVNPLLAKESGVTALDALVTLSE